MAAFDNMLSVLYHCYRLLVCDFNNKYKTCQWISKNLWSRFIRSSGNCVRSYCHFSNSCGMAWKISLQSPFAIGCVSPCHSSLTHHIDMVLYIGWPFWWIKNVSELKDILENIQPVFIFYSKVLAGKWQLPEVKSYGWVEMTLQLPPHNVDSIQDSATQKVYVLGTMLPLHFSGFCKL